MSSPAALRVTLVAAMVLGGSALSLVATVPTTSAQEGTSGGSALTKSGEGEFKDLEVTVSQTKNLTNQTVRVSWAGGAPTPGTPTTNFLQIMQCWGDDPGPDRTQCQFGAIAGEPPLSGSPVRGRGTNPMDPAELQVDPAKRLVQGPDRGQVVPFWPAGAQRPTTFATDSTNEFFDAQVTNEVPIAITRPDGTGQVDFELQTVRQSAGLGCGEPVEVNGTTAGRPCWLVVVPRGTKETNGAPAEGNGLVSSPLAQANWDKKIAVPLEFRPQGRPCRLGAPERPLTGHELVVDAVSAWQPALCADGGALYSFVQLTDDLVRDQLFAAGDPGLALISNPVTPDQQRPDRPLVYAPVAVSGLAFAFNIVAAPPGTGAHTPNDPRLGVAGRPFPEMRLTARLVAKLLTQSYRAAIATFGQAVPEGQGVPAQPERLQSNPWGLTNDPEFLALNPGYLAEVNPAFPDRDLLPANLHVDALVQLGTSDLTGLLWDWVLADPEARDFIAGTPDPWGMVVNEANKDIRAPLHTYPRNDQSCKPVTVPRSNPQPGESPSVIAPFCTADEHQFAIDMHEAGRNASRGDTLGRFASGTIAPDGRVTFARQPRQPVTARALMAVIDAATADRYGMPTAKLRNAAGEFVAPDAAGLRAGLDAMKPSAMPGVLRPDPATTNRAAYPLTALSYAATSPPVLTEDAGRDYAAFLRYATGPGQQPGRLPGQLPLGYLPLPEPLRQQALAAATIIETQAGKTTEPPPEATPAPVRPDVTGPDLLGEAPPGDLANNNVLPNEEPLAVTPTVIPKATVPVTAAAPPAAVPQAVTQRPVSAPGLTPASVIFAMGGLLLALLISGSLAAGLATVAHRLGAPRRAIADKEVMPTGP